MKRFGQNLHWQSQFLMHSRNKQFQQSVFHLPLLKLLQQNAINCYAVPFLNLYTFNSKVLCRTKERSEMSTKNKSTFICVLHFVCYLQNYNAQNSTQNAQFVLLNLCFCACISCIPTSGIQRIYLACLFSHILQFCSMKLVVGIAYSNVLHILCYNWVYVSCMNHTYMFHHPCLSSLFFVQRQFYIFHIWCALYFHDILKGSHFLEFFRVSL